ncbi:MAG TPA: cytidylate kinase-like family protein, partial [Candidatus Binataceae bacterium]|nr:cytidylate kinase-like family protein [Candidatus Binataceae bacterium]
MAIIAITQHVGMRGADLARLTAERLGYRFLTSEQLVAAASRTYHVPADALAVVDERRTTFWTRFKTDTGRISAFFRSVVLKEMARDQLVVIGRSVAQILPDIGCGLRVRLCGPIKERTRVAAAEEKLSAALAEARVRDYDREVRARIQTLFGVDIDDPSNYNLVLNVFAVPLEASAALLATFAAEVDRAATGEHWGRMHDAALTAEIRAALLAHAKLGNAPFRVQCSGGVVQVVGVGIVPPWDDIVSEVVRRVNGVRSVQVLNQEMPPDPWQTY